MAYFLKPSSVSINLFFFFQAEDGIRDLTVTGVQTCALPISSPAPGSVRCLQLLGRTWLAPIPESRDHPLHRPFLDKLISENGPAENPQEIILNSLPCKCLFLWDLSRHRFQPDCLLRPLNI